MANPKKPGRPTKYSAKIANDILELLSSTSMGLDSICKKNKMFPGASTVRRWISEDKEGFRDKYVRAREHQADLIADEINEIADSVAKKKDISHEAINAARLRIDSRKWIASKLKPKVYGDKTDITTNGKDVITPPPIVLLDAEKLTEEQIQHYLNNGRS